MHNYTPFVITGNDKNKQLTLLSQKKAQRLFRPRYLSIYVSKSPIQLKRQPLEIIQHLLFQALVSLMCHINTIFVEYYRKCRNLRKYMRYSWLAVLPHRYICRIPSRSLHWAIFSSPRDQSHEGQRSPNGRRNPYPIHPSKIKVRGMSLCMLQYLHQHLCVSSNENKYVFFRASSCGFFIKPRRIRQGKRRQRVSKEKDRERRNFGSVHAVILSA
jgi:hypothetical protein